MKEIFDVLREFMPLSLSLISICFVYIIYLYTKISRKMNDLADKQSQYLKDRIDSVDKTTGIFERTINRQENEIKQLNETLIKANVNPQSLDIEGVISNVKDDFKDAIKMLTDKIENSLILNDNDFEAIISLANAYATNKEWIKSAEQYEKASKIKDTLWDLYFSQGIAFANARIGTSSNIKALQSYSSAIAFFPDEADFSLNVRLDNYKGRTTKRLLKELESEKKIEIAFSNIKARLYIYKGAMLKRLHRLEEAESDIILGLKYASMDYEKNDGLYNLACVYAMQNRKVEYSKIASQLKENNTSYFKYLLEKINEYAPKFEIN